MKGTDLRIGSRRVGAAHPVYVIAEMSANHGGDFGRALRLVEAAKEAGADAIKLQTYTPDTMTLDCDAAPFRIRGTIWDGATLHRLYQQAQTPWDWHEPLQKRARELDLDFFSSPFDSSAVDLLERLGVPAYKVASFELVDLPLLRRIAATGKPVIASTGMATLEEVEEAVRTLREAGCRELALLKCTSAYPTPPEQTNLRAIPLMHEIFGVPIGFSDHTLGPTAAVAAVALGASLIEKHLTLSRSEATADSAFSLEPAEFKAMVAAVREARASMGEARLGPSPSEEACRAFRRSLFVVEDVAGGETFTARNVRGIRPAGGLHTRHLEEVVGRRAKRAVSRGTPLSWDLVER